MRGPRFLTHSSMPTLQLWGGKLGTMDKAVFVYRMVLRFNLFHVMRGREALSRGELPDGIMRTLARVPMPPSAPRHSCACGRFNHIEVAQAHVRRDARLQRRNAHAPRAEHARRQNEL